MQNSRPSSERAVRGRDSRSDAWHPGRRRAGQDVSSPPHGPRGTQGNAEGHIRAEESL